MNHPVSKPALSLFKLVSWGGGSLLALSLAGCSNLLYPMGANSPDQPTQLQPQRTINELLAQRLHLCSQDKIKRAEQLKTLRSQLQQQKKEDTSKLESELDGLMLTSCEPAGTPALMGEVLNHLLSMGQWPMDYDHLFDLLRSQQRALTHYNARLQENSRESLELRQALQNQKEEFNKLQSSYKDAINGIGDIEETLDSRKSTRMPSP